MKHRRRGRRARRGAGQAAEVKVARRAERVGEGPYSVRKYWSFHT